MSQVNNNMSTRLIDISTRGIIEILQQGKITHMNTIVQLCLIQKKDKHNLKKK